MIIEGGGGGGGGTCACVCMQWRLGGSEVSDVDDGLIWWSTVFLWGDWCFSVEC